MSAPGPGRECDHGAVTIDEAAVSDDVVATLRRAGARFASARRRGGTAQPSSDLDVAAVARPTATAWDVVLPEGVDLLASTMHRSSCRPVRRAPALRRRRLASMAGNHSLVHQYAAIDDTRTVAFLDQIGDFDAFVAQVSAWLPGQDD